MSYHLKLSIPGLPHTTNSLGRAHWAVKAKEAKKWRWCVVILVGDRAPKKPLKKAKITLTRHSANSPDFDGLVSSFKAILDGLVDAGVLINDKMECTGTPEYIWEKTGRRAGKVTIEVSELPVPSPVTV